MATNADSGGESQNVATAVPKPVMDPTAAGLLSTLTAMQTQHIQELEAKDTLLTKLTADLQAKTQALTDAGAADTNSKLAIWNLKTQIEKLGSEKKLMSLEIDQLKRENYTERARLVKLESEYRERIAAIQADHRSAIVSYFDRVAALEQSCSAVVGILMTPGGPYAEVCAERGIEVGRTYPVAATEVYGAEVKDSGAGDSVKEKVDEEQKTIEGNPVDAIREEEITSPTTEELSFIQDETIPGAAEAPVKPLDVKEAVQESIPATPVVLVAEPSTKRKGRPPKAKKSKTPVSTKKGKADDKAAEDSIVESIKGDDSMGPPAKKIKIAAVTSASSRPRRTP